jgi:Zn-dependent protease with chaperone function
LRRVLIALQILALIAAVALAVAPVSPSTVERYYADWFYPALQTRLTSWSNETSVALFDFALLVQIIAVVALLSRSVGRAMRRRSVLPMVRGGLAIATVFALVYLWFEVAWGLNYARVPLAAGIGYDPGRVTEAEVRRLAERAVLETNNGYTSAHASGFPAIGEIPPALVVSFHEVERRLGRPRPTVPGRPKRTVLSPFFRASCTDGMHAPFLLETLLNPDLTPAERPAVLAHEWAHLAGYAPEDDASFVGLIAAMRADPGARYSAWLTLAFEAANELPRRDRERVLSGLAAGPRLDQQAIAVRLQTRVESVQRASWQTYDHYLKSQGVAEGLRSYSRVVQLLVGSGAIDW